MSDLVTVSYLLLQVSADGDHMPEPFFTFILRTLGERPGARPYVDGANDAQMDVALEALHRGGFVAGLELTEKARKLLEDLSDPGRAG